MGIINVIIGPPCAGKSTYVQNESKDGDVIVDYDLLATAFGNRTKELATGSIRTVALAGRMAAINQITTDGNIPDTSWIIHTDPNPELIQRYKDAGAKFTLVDPGESVCIQRAKDEGRSEETIYTISNWYLNPPSIKYNQIIKSLIHSVGYSKSINLLSRKFVEKYSPDQPRDEHGRWTDEGGGDDYGVEVYVARRNEGGDDYIGNGKTHDISLMHPKPTLDEEPFNYYEPPEEYEGIEVRLGLGHPSINAQATYGVGRPFITINEIGSNDIESIKDAYNEGWYSNNNINQVIWHETGHVQSYNVMGREKFDEFHKSFNSPIKRSSDFNRIANKVSGQAATHGAEFLAETYSGLRAGKKYDNEVMGLYNDILSGEYINGKKV